MSKIYLVFILLILSFSSCSSEIKTNTDSNTELEDFKKKAIELTKDPNQLILNEYSFANLQLEGNFEPLSIGLIQEKLKDYNIEISSYEGFDENGPTVYYSGWKGGQQIFTLTMDKESNNKNTNMFAIQYQGVIDQYGAKIGMNYNQIKLLRPEIIISKDLINGGPIVSSKGSQIFYTFCCVTEQKESYIEEDLVGLKVQSIHWKSLSYK